LTADSESPPPGGETVLETMHETNQHTLHPTSTYEIAPIMGGLYGDGIIALKVGVLAGVGEAVG